MGVWRAQANLSVHVRECGCVWCLCSSICECGNTCARVAVCMKVSWCRLVDLGICAVDMCVVVGIYGGYLC